MSVYFIVLYCHELLTAHAPSLLLFSPGSGFHDMYTQYSTTHYMLFYSLWPINSSNSELHCIDLTVNYLSDNNNNICTLLCTVITTRDGWDGGRAL